MRGCPARSRKLDECWDPPTLPVTRSQRWLETSEIYLFQPGPGRTLLSLGQQFPASSNRPPRLLYQESQFHILP